MAKKYTVMQKGYENTPSVRAELMRTLRYCPATGLFTWRGIGRHPDGAPAGCPHAHGYITINVRPAASRILPAHRLAWLFIHGSLTPGMQIDHINGVKTDNRICNLREVSQEMNMQNVRGPRKSRKSAGRLGAYFVKSVAKWVAQMQVSSRQVTIGYYLTEDEAYSAYLEYRRKHMPGNTL